MVVTSLFGLLAAFQLTIEKFASLANPGHVASCDISVLVSCSKNLESSYGSLFGFPNPVIGLIFWPMILTVGVALLGNTRFPDWFWRALTLGVTLALLLVAGFVSISLYRLGTLCPWCMLTWSMVIPLFWTVVLYAVKSGHIVGDAAVRRVGAKLFEWVPLLTVLSYLLVIVLAQLQLDAVPRVIHDLFG